MKKYNLSPLMLMLMAAFIIIDGSTFALYSVLFALWHELWHIIILKLNKREFVFYTRSHGLELKTGLLSYKEDATVALAGPVSSLLLGACLLPFDTLLSLCNFAIGILNLIPIWPLDGARALLSLLSLKTDRCRATRIIRILSYIFLLPLCFLSVIILIKTGYNLSLLIVCIFLMIGVKEL